MTRISAIRSRQDRGFALRNPRRASGSRSARPDCRSPRRRTNMTNASPRRDQIVNVRINPADNLKFKQVAQSLQTSRSNLLRKAILESIGRGPILLPQEMKAFEQGVFQMAALGRNLNQLLRLVHSG